VLRQGVCEQVFLGKDASAQAISSAAPFLGRSCAHPCPRQQGDGFSSIPVQLWRCQPSRWIDLHRHELRTTMKVLLVVLAPTAIAFACASAGAQVGSDSVQDHTLSGGQRNSTQPASASRLSPLLGAPQDDAENDLPDSRATSPTPDHRSIHGNNARSQQPAPDSPPSPLLGAPGDYEDRYASSLEYEPGNEAATREAANYKLTPVEQLLAPDLAERSHASAAGAMSHHIAVSTDVAGRNQQSQGFEPVTTLTPTLTSASRRDSPNGTAGSDAASAIYKSPW
jgi:hypothetical protein